MANSISNRENNAASYFLQVWDLNLLRLFCMVVLVSLAGCATPPQAQRQTTIQPPPEQHSSPVVSTALSLLNRPYRYGGDSPSGFDCSGLVYYAHLRNGIPIPRTTRDQHRRARPVSLRELTPGDLLFFRETRRKPSHVGLYVGDDRFIHASTSEQAVTLSSLSNPYWRKHLLGAGRYSP
jgi:cell wall-associated NlpC family hydrolase